MHGFKRDILPDHCGTCIFLEWEEYTCRCINPAYDVDVDIREYLADECDATTTEKEVAEIAWSQWGWRLDDMDWHGYDSVCDLYHKFTTVQDRDQAEIEAREAYINRVLCLWREMFYPAAEEGER